MGAVLGGFVILAGCGGGSAAPPDTPDTPAAPATSTAPSTPEVPSYTVAELRAALPGVDDVPGAERRTAKCPDKSSDTCALKGGTLVSVDFALERPSTGSAAGDEAAANAALFGDSVFVSVQSYDSVKARNKSIAGTEKAQAESDGRFRTEGKSLGPNSYVPGTKGSGSTQTVTVDGWEGSILDRKFTLIDLDGVAMGDRIEAWQYVSQGKVVVRVLVSVGAPGRTRAEAANQVNRLVTDYLARLSAETTD